MQIVHYTEFYSSPSDTAFHSDRLEICLKLCEMIIPYFISMLHFLLILGAPKKYPWVGKAPSVNWSIQCPNLLY